MKRFVLVLALVAVAGATYVATAPGSQTAAPTARQFKALKKEVTGLKKAVTGLKKEVGLVKGLAVADTGLLLDCVTDATPIAQFGEGDGFASTYGYSWQDPSENSGQPWLETALDVTTSDDPDALWVVSGTSACATDLGVGPLRHRLAASAGLPLPKAAHVTLQPRLQK